MTDTKHPAKVLVCVPHVLRGSVWCSDADTMLRRIPALEAELAREREARQQAQIDLERTQEQRNRAGIEVRQAEGKRLGAEIARLQAALDDAQAGESMAQMEAKRAGFPSTPEEVMDFIGSNFCSVEYAHGVDELGRPLGAASEHDSYCVSAHDLLSAFSNWCWADLPAAERVPLTDERIDAIADAMPGGLDGFCKGWGWRQFAREIESEIRGDGLGALHGPFDTAEECIAALKGIRMVLCPTCGNKRCPHATDKAYACTGSNEPGQAGSAYAGQAAVCDSVQVEHQSKPAEATQGKPLSAAEIVAEAKGRFTLATSAQAFADGAPRPTPHARNDRRNHKESQMTCNCVKTVNENLKSRNTRLSLGFSMTQDYGVISRLLIQTEKADKNSRVKMTSVTATFCPFCGVKFNGCAFGEETTCVKSVDAT